MSAGHPGYSAFVPRHGVIVGGPMDGWQYAILRFHCWPSGQVDPIVKATRPGWPFPQDVVLTHGSYGRLESIKGVRTNSVSVKLMNEMAIAEAQQKKALWSAT